MENRNSVITLPKTPIEDLEGIRCCQLDCNPLLTDIDANIHPQETEIPNQEYDNPKLYVRNGEDLPSIPMASQLNINQNFSPNEKYHVDSQETQTNIRTHHPDSISANDQARISEIAKRNQDNKSQKYEEK
ncbi:hypothetical protein RF11_03708 [Thelohanellus kitauei]|uniref:Uncharacterized protein n=1 Tax=Thelohanellus kitauei TaxID=669202 RepID=A0A0C2J0H6_THEKT|nr:hypothetical protein RF11_03708 [Thelohanellus kitauei]